MNTIYKDRENLSSSEILKYRDFHSLLDKSLIVPTKPAVKIIWKYFSYSSISLILILTIAWYFFQRNKEEIKPDAIKTIPVKFIAPPVPDWDKPFEYAVYFNTVDTIITFSDRTKIEIRRNSFLDSAGKIVDGRIDIRYRKFMNTAEIFLSGIPMEYDSASIKWDFSSAGMIQLEAYQDNKPLKILLGKPIHVTFRSDFSGNAYNLYYLDTLNGKWIYKGKDKVSAAKNKKPDQKSESKYTLISGYLEDSLKLIKTSIIDLEKLKPEPPISINVQKWHISLDIQKNEFPELAVYDKTLFEIDESYKKLNSADPARLWIDIKIEKAEKPMYYYLNFSRGRDSCRYRVYPVLSGESYKKELKNYEGRFAVYKEELSKREKQEVRLKEETQKQLLARRSDSVLYAEQSRSFEREQGILRSFPVTVLGVWNCDQPVSRTGSRVLNPVYMIDDSLYQKTVVLFDLTRNILIRHNPGSELRFEKKSKKILFMITKEKELAIFRNEEFEKIGKIEQSYVFDLHKVSGKIGNYYDFMQLYKTDFR